MMHVNMGGIPGRKKPRFYENKWLVEGVAAIPPAVIAFVAGWGNFLDEQSSNDELGLVLVGSAVWLVLAGVLKVLNAHSQDEQLKQELNYDGLQGALSVFHKSLLWYSNIPDDKSDDGTLRLTIHRVVPLTGAKQGSEEIEQLLPYIGGPGKEPGRRFSVRSGIVGRAVREKAPFVAARQNDDYEQFIGELVSEWSYTEEDARNLSPDRQSWMAVPIFKSSKKAVVAVVFLDSKESTLFDGERQNLILSGCSGIARYIDERYRYS